MHTHIYIRISLFIQWFVNIYLIINFIYNYALFILMLQFSPIWLVEASSSWFLYPCGRSPSFFKCFLLFWHKMLQAYFLISCPGFIVRHFAKEPSLLLRKLAFRKEDLGPGCVQCFWGIAVSRTSQWDRSREYIYTHDPTIISISISISTSISIEK